MQPKMGETHNGTHHVAKHKHPKTKSRKKRKQNLQETSPYPDLNLNLERSDYGVQPMGNLLFNSDSFNARDVGLGTLTLFKDETLVEVFGLLDAKDLGRLALVSKAMYVFSNQDSLWRALVLDHLKGTFTFQGSWKSTYIAAHWPNAFEALGVPFKVSNFYSDYLFQSWLCANLEMKQEWLEVDNIERRDKLSLQEFIDSFEEPNKPVLIRDGLANWAALNKWDRDYLCEVAGEVEFAVGPVEMKLRDYFVYADSVKEERPLCLFDPKFGEKVPTLAEDYEIPIYFREDLFSLLGKERPDYRWLILGPARSGSSFHIDPNSTSAWSAVIRGSKKWILFPPDVVPPGVHPSPDGAKVASPVSIIEWFMNFYWGTKHWKKRPTECICRAGEVIFVPNGWWHLVINLEDSIAITQNYVSRRNLLNVLDFLSRPNSRELVSGTKDRVNLYDKFRSVYETLKPGSIDELKCKELKKKSASFWESATDAKAGAFKFGFRSVYETLKPGSIDELKCKEEEKKLKKKSASFGESATDAKAGAFKFGFKSVNETLKPGSIDELKCKEEQKKLKMKSAPFGESATDAKAGAFKSGFKSVYETLTKGSIDELKCKEEEKILKMKSASFWESAIDAKAGAFKFGFRSVYETLKPGSTDELKCKEEENKLKMKSASFWESATDAKAGAFKFGF